MKQFDPEANMCIMPAEFQAGLSHITPVTALEGKDAH